ncbi:MAG: hypothetical protein M0Q24_07490 [Sulfurimonas sp.]|nr:hypothetical protein [Sulfurimonas sp.]MCK9491917.1 hypothetical protein [Sulfurimonas sp.]
MLETPQFRGLEVYFGAWGNISEGPPLVLTNPYFSISTTLFKTNYFTLS